MSDKKKFDERAYVIEYNATKTTRVFVRLNYVHDADIIEHLGKQSNKQGYIKGLIREDIAKQNN